MMKRAILAALILLVGGSTAFAGDTHWLHVYVEDKGGDGEKVRVNVPFSLIEAVIPLIDEAEFSDGKIRINDDDFTSEDMHRILKAVREAEDGEYVTVEGVDENVRVHKKGDYLKVNVVEGSKRSDADETVDVQIHMSVLEALTSGEPDELDVLAAIEALGKHGGGEFVVVKSDDEMVRVWVDQSASGE
jgi:hypothetical protein